MEDASLLLAGGTVVTGAGRVRPGHDVWIRDGKIAAIDPTNSQPVPDCCEVIDARGAIVMPGLVDSHRHLWQTPLRGMCSDMIAPEYRHQVREALVPHFRPEDVYTATLAGALELIDCGVTTVMDWVHILNSPEHADASIAALRDAGVRAVFAPSAPNDEEAPLWWSNSARKHPQDVRRMRRILSDDGALVTMGFGARAPQLVQREVRVHDWNLARELGVRIFTDGGIGGGLWGEPTFPIRLLDEDDLLWPGTVYIHCNNLAADEYERIAATGGHVSMSPCAELHVGFGMPATRSALAHGIKPALSIDSVIFVAGDMFGTMRSTLGCLRGLAALDATERGEGVGRWNVLTSDVFEMATVYGAQALGLGDRIGTLDVGKAADIVMLNARSPRLAPLNNPIASIVLLATPADVDTVIVEGRVLKRAGRHIHDRQERAVDAVIKSRDWLLNQGGAKLGADAKNRLLDSGCFDLLGR